MPYMRGNHANTMKRQRFIKKYFRVWKQLSSLAVGSYLTNRIDSAAYFVGKVIRFGLAAIKGVGEVAVLRAFLPAPGWSGQIELERQSCGPIPHLEH